jgi:23S rRNA (cytidine1920-2'-O)/16S rRNA (cytidine1409-2'-O)-methyltransferase
LGKDGVVRSAAHHVLALSNVIEAAAARGWPCAAAAPSRLPGAAGNREFFVLLRQAECSPDLDLTALVAT